VANHLKPSCTLPTHTIAYQHTTDHNKPPSVSERAQQPTTKDIADVSVSAHPLAEAPTIKPKSHLPNTEAPHHTADQTQCALQLYQKPSCRSHHNEFHFGRPRLRVPRRREPPRIAYTPMIDPNHLQLTTLQLPGWHLPWQRLPHKAIQSTQLTVNTIEGTHILLGRRQTTCSNHISAIARCEVS
jgi:hypothetical protein